MMNKLLKITGFIAIAGIIAVGCDSVVDGDSALTDAVSQEHTLMTANATTSNIVIVTPENLMGWEEVNVQGDGESEINGVVPDQHGGGASLKQSFSDSEGKTDFRLLQSFGPVDELTELSFNWYRDGSSTAPGHLTPVVGIFVDDNEGNSWLLKWEGAYNGYPTTGPDVPTNEWIAENLLEGNFWRIPQFVNGEWVGFAGCNNTFTDPYGCFQFNRSLTDEWLDGFEVAGVEIGIGSGWSGTFLSYADHLTINDTTFDFELEVPADGPETIEDCKNGGWEQFDFRNQGQCIRYVNTGKDSR